MCLCVCVYVCMCVCVYVCMLILWPRTYTICLCDVYELFMYNNRKLMLLQELGTHVSHLRRQCNYWASAGIGLRYVNIDTGRCAMADVLFH